MPLILPPSFSGRMCALLNNEFEAFSDALLHQKSKTAIRLNPRKMPQGIFETTQPVPWYALGLLLQNRPVFAADPLWHCGAYYVQEPSSMFVAEAVRQCCNLQEPLFALDLCAAPGGKTTLLAATLHPDSLLVANEVIKTRIPALLENVQKWGAGNIWVTNNDPADYAPFTGFFDLVLTDAPCSGEGLFRKTPDAVKEWSEQNVQLCSARQRRILAHAAKLVKPGGVLLYSTCTFSPEENEHNVAWVAEHGNFTPLRLQLPAVWGITETTYPAQNGQTGYGYRFYPHKTPGEGFFIACLRKNGIPPKDTKPPAGGRKTQHQPFALSGKKDVVLLSRWLQQPDGVTFYTKNQTDVFALPAGQGQLLPYLAEHLIVKSAGIEMGQIKGGELVPSPALALCPRISDKIPVLQLNYEEAIAYLKKETFNLQYPPDLKGWALVSFNRQPLGWVKLMPGRWNNYYPAEWRLRK
ncbi:RNA methyltransferase [Sphingobacteriales bacterium UPWRP_1]|nr:RNA methyltransferase [Sphingobacteriales bacterium UPWRP_1]